MVTVLGNLHRIELRPPRRPHVLQILPLFTGVGLFQTRAMPCRPAAATCNNQQTTADDMPACFRPYCAKLAVPRKHSQPHGTTNQVACTRLLSAHPTSSEPYSPHVNNPHPTPLSCACYGTVVHMGANCELQRTALLLPTAVQSSSGVKMWHLAIVRGSVVALVVPVLPGEKLNLAHVRLSGPSGPGQSLP